jgi:ubiquinol-cytochrome c reductase cytochrome b/c1 subunit
MRLALRITLAAGFVLGLAAPSFAQDHGASFTRRADKAVDLSFEGPLGTYDRGALQRGYQVYKEVCAACHGLKRVAFRNLTDEGGPGFSVAQARALAAGVQVPAEPNAEGLTHNDSGERLTRPGILADYFQPPFPNDNAARTANGGALPPDLSLFVKTRRHGSHYVYSILTGYGEKPPAGYTVTKDKHFNPWFEGWSISMPAPLTNNGVTFSDGTPATIDQQARDVVTFLSWAAEPKMEQRKRMGFSVLLFLAAFATVLFFAYRKVWADAH